MKNGSRQALSWYGGQARPFVALGLLGKVLGPVGERLLNRLSWEEIRDLMAYLEGLPAK